MLHMPASAFMHQWAGAHEPSRMCPLRCPQGEGEQAVLPPEPLPTVLCAGSFGEDGLLRVVGRKLRHAPPAPVPSLFWAAGLSFSRAQLLLEVRDVMGR